MYPSPVKKRKEQDHPDSSNNNNQSKRTISTLELSDEGYILDDEKESGEIDEEIVDEIEEEDEEESVALSNASQTINETNVDIHRVYLLVKQKKITLLNFIANIKNYKLIEQCFDRTPGDDNKNVFHYLTYFALQNYADQKSFKDFFDSLIVNAGELWKLLIAREYLDEKTGETKRTRLSPFQKAVGMGRFFYVNLIIKHTINKAKADYSVLQCLDLDLRNLLEIGEFEESFKKNRKIANYLIIYHILDVISNIHVDKNVRKEFTSFLKLVICKTDQVAPTIQGCSVYEKHNHLPLLITVIKKLNRPVYFYQIVNDIFSIFAKNVETYKQFDQKIRDTSDEGCNILLFAATHWLYSDPKLIKPLFNILFQVENNYKALNSLGGNILHTIFDSLNIGSIAILESLLDNITEEQFWELFTSRDKNDQTPLACGLIKLQGKREKAFYYMNRMCILINNHAQHFQWQKLSEYKSLLSSGEDEKFSIYSSSEWRDCYNKHFEKHYQRLANLSSVMNKMPRKSPSKSFQLTTTTTTTTTTTNNNPSSSQINLQTVPSPTMSTELLNLIYKYNPQMKSIETLEKEIQAQQKTNSENIVVITNLRNEIKNLKSKQQEDQKFLNDYEEQNEKINNEKSDLEERISVLNEKLEKSAKQIEDMTKTNTEKLSLLEKEKKILLAEKANLIEVVTTKDSTIAKLKKEIEDLKNKEEEQALCNSKLQDEINKQKEKETKESMKMAKFLKKRGWPFSENGNPNPDADTDLKGSSDQKKNLEELKFSTDISPKESADFLLRRYFKRKSYNFQMPNRRYERFKRDFHGPCVRNAICYWGEESFFYFLKELFILRYKADENNFNTINNNNTENKICVLTGNKNGIGIEITIKFPNAGKYEKHISEEQQASEHGSDIQVDKKTINPNDRIEKWSNGNKKSIQFEIKSTAKATFEHSTMSFTGPENKRMFFDKTPVIRIYNAGDESVDFLKLVPK